MNVALSMDVGTSSLKAALVDADHGVIAQSSAPMPYVREGIIDEKQAWLAGASLISSLVHDSDVNIAGVIISGQGDGLWGVDQNGNGIDAYTWNSTFASDVVREWQDNGIIDRLYRITGTATCLTFFERVGCGGASSGMSANGIGPVWLVLWKTGSAWRRSGRSP